MKGISLPINILIIIAVAVIALIAIVSMFFPAFKGGERTVSLDVAKSQACRSLVIGHSCSTEVGLLSKIAVYDYDSNGNGQTNEIADNLMALCIEKYQTRSEPECRMICGCEV